MTYFARDEYTATAGQKNFTVSFSYLEEEHVKVYVNQTEQTEFDDYTFSTPTTITFTYSLDEGDSVLIYRDTSSSTRLVDWANGSTLSAEDLDIDSYQAFFLAQEALDWVSATISLYNEEGNIDVGGVRVINLTTPVDDNDAATKGYVDSLSLAAGNVIDPTPGEIGYILYADGEASWVWKNPTDLFGTAAVEDIGTTSGTLCLLGTGGAFEADRYVTMVGDSGAGGTKGAVPAPAAGDAAAGKYLNAGGTWSAPNFLTGMIVIWPGADLPGAAGDWLWCNGQAVSRTTYSTLFSLIGTTFGSGDGSTTFNVPDLRGRVPMGKDNMGGTDAARVTSSSTGGGNADTLGGVGGAQTHTLTTAELPAHSHKTNITVTSGGTLGKAALGTTGTSEQDSEDTGGGDAHSNTAPWISLNYIIKT